MSKGVSAVIATILLLLITIALAATAYVFVSGMMGGRTSKLISLLDASCTSNSITLVISNDGTSAITSASDIKVFVGNTEDATLVFSTSTLNPHATLVISGVDGGVVSGTNTILIVSPTNAIHSTVFC